MYLKSAKASAKRAALKVALAAANNLSHLQATTPVGFDPTNPDPFEAYALAQEKALRGKWNKNHKSLMAKMRARGHRFGNRSIL